MPDLMSNAVSGLLSMQQALTTTGQNIANANTPGYSRQSVNLATLAPQYQSGGYIGSGVQVASVSRSYDQFVASQLNSATADNSRLSFLNNLFNTSNPAIGGYQNGYCPANPSFF